VLLALAASFFTFFLASFLAALFLALAAFFLAFAALFLAFPFAAFFLAAGIFAARCGAYQSGEAEYNNLNVFHDELFV